MATISFSQVGSFNGVDGGPSVLTNPTSLQFGPDGRLYVAEQNGSINAFTIAIQNGEYVATAHEVLQLANGSEVVRSIQNHNDDGSLAGNFNRQVTGIVVTGTAANPVLYVSSSDPRIAQNGEANLDTNSGVVTRLTWNGNAWEAVDIIRGLPRSEENHAVNGLALSPDGNSLYLAVGGNTNNGAPSQFFSFISEFALSGTVLEIDLADLESRPILTDPDGGQGGTARQFIYDLPTLDDPTVPNDGVREDANGLDVAGPFGGNDGFNQAILPADAPLRIFADGLRNNFDLVLTESGNLFTVDNGSNTNLGGDPIFVNGEVTNLPNAEANASTGSPEPLFLLTDGGFFGHPNPTRSNQDLEFVVRDDDGNPDASLPINTVPDLSALVPDSVDIPDGFIIDPSRFTGDPDRLFESGVRVPAQSSESLSLVNLGSSSNGLVEFTSDVFDGALQGALIVTQFNGSVTLLNVNEAGTALEPLIDPGVDGLLGTTDDEVIDNDGVFPLVTSQSQPLDVTVGPDGTIFVAEFGPDNINVFAPADTVQGFDTDLDNDGILNVNDPFTRDATNGGSATLSPGQTLLFDFDANQDDNLAGPNGFGGGLTGVLINNATDFEAFFLEPSPFPGQIINLDNVKFTTAAGGGTTVIENASSGTPFGSSNDGEFLFQTGVTIAPAVDTFTVTWSIFNPASFFTASSQRIGGFIGTGDQSDFLSITAGPDPNGEIQIVLEENDVTEASTFLQANDLFDVPDGQQIFFELEIDPTAATATPTVTYETGNGNTNTVSGGPISLAGTEVLEAILGNHTIQGQTAGLAVGLLSTTNANGNQPGADTFQAVFDDIEIAAAGSNPNPNPSSDTTLFRVNAGGPLIAATDGGPDWLADTNTNNSAFLLDPGSNSTFSFPAVEPGPSVASSVPGAIFDTERFDRAGGSNLQYAFDVPATGDYEVRLYLANGFLGTSAPGQRVFDVALEGSVPSNLNDVDLSAQFGSRIGGVISNVVTVDDGTLNVEFLHEVQNPLINGIEIIQLDGSGSPTPPPTTNPVVSIAATQDAAEPNSNGQFTVSLSEAASTNTVIAYSVGGTATPGADYAALSGTVTLPAGALSANIDVAVIDDQLDESEESVTVTLDAITAGDADVLLGTSNSAAIAIADDDVTAPPNPSPGSDTTLFRVNAGGPLIAATDGGPDWLADTSTNNSDFLLDPGSNSTFSVPAVEPGPTVPSSVPGAIFDTERFDQVGGSNLQYAFDVPATGDYEVRLYLANGFLGTSAPGQRVFDVAVEGSVPSNLNDVDLSAQFGSRIGGVISNVVTVDDGTLNVEFLHEVQNPLINGIEIIQLDGSGSPTPPPTTNPVVSIAATQDAAEPNSNGQFTVSLSEAASTNTVIAYSVGGTATPGADYAALSGTVTLPAGALSANIDVAVIDDQLDESEESVTVTLDAITAGDADVLLGTSNSAAIAIADDDVTAPPNPSPGSDTTLFRVNAGGPLIAATDGGPDWLADTSTNNSDFLLDPGSNRTTTFPAAAISPGPTVDSSVPTSIFTTERFDGPGGTEMQYAFDVPAAGDYEVRLYLANGFLGTSAPGQRVFDVALEGSVPSNLNDVDLSAQFGSRIGGVISNVVTVDDGTLNIEFLHGVQNPLVNGIEIVQLG